MGVRAGFILALRPKVRGRGCERGADMSLRPCKECGKQISSDAKACPHCGKKRPINRGSLVILGVLVAILIVGAYMNRNIGQAPLPSPADDAQFAHAAAGAKMLHDAARNPDSFKLVQVLTMSDGTACYTYRAQNGFGGMNVGYALLSSANDLKTDDMRGFHALWDKVCAHKSGTDRTQTVAYAIAHTGLRKRA